MSKETNKGISKDVAEAIFGLYAINPITVLKEMQAGISDENFHYIRKNLRILMIGTKIYLSYKRDDIRQVIRTVCSKFIHAIYSDKEFTEADSLKLLIYIVFHFRNCRTIKEFKGSIDPTFEGRVKEAIKNQNLILEKSRLPCF